MRRSGLFTACLALISVILTALPATGVARTSYVTDPGAAQAAVDKVMASVGRKAAIFSIRIEPDRVSVQVQGAERAHHIDEWQLVRYRLRDSDAFSFERVRGPAAVTTSGIVAETEKGFFDPGEVALDRFNAVIAAAVDRARLEDRGWVTGVTIARQVSILPQRAFGPVRWEIAVTSGRESATVYADGGGDVTGVDLANTERARRLDLLSDDWPMEDAARDLASALSQHAVYEVRVYRGYVFIVTQHPGDRSLRRDYVWKLDGVRISYPDTPFISVMTMMANPPQPFRISELDLTALPHIKAAAAERFGVADARLDWMSAEKRQIGTRPPVLHWELRYKTPNGEAGEVLAAPDGTILKMVLPPSLQPKLSYLDPAALPDLFARVAAEFPADTKFISLDIRSDRVNVEYRDTADRRKVASASVTPERVSTSNMSMPAMMLPDNADFGTADFGDLSAEALKQMVEQSMAARIDGKGEISRLTVERGNAFMRSPDGKLTVTVWLDMPAGTGRITYASDGRMIDAVGP